MFERPPNNISHVEPFLRGLTAPLACVATIFFVLAPLGALAAFGWQWVE